MAGVLALGGCGASHYHHGTMEGGKSDATP